jgi:hypothetical protein
MPLILIPPDFDVLMHPSIISVHLVLERLTDFTLGAAYLFQISQTYPGIIRFFE